jgi:SAM-dependent methyltransferase
MAQMYLDGEYRARNPGYHVEDSAWKAEQIMRMVTRHRLPVQSVAEIGCGAGAILVELQRRMPPGTTFTGYEISPHAAELAQTREGPGIQFVCGDFLSLEPPVVDLVLCIDVMEHVEDCVGFLRRLRSRGEYKILHIPLEMSVQAVLRSTPLVRAREQVGHLHYFSRETALLTLRDAGYDVLDHFFTRIGIERPNTTMASLAAAPRALAAAISPALAARLLGGFSLLVLAR